MSRSSADIAERMQRIRPSALLEQGYLFNKSPAHTRQLAAHCHRALRENPAYWCEGVTKSPPHARCTQPRVIGEKFCRHHLPLKRMALADSRRRSELLHKIEHGTWEGLRFEARRRLNAADRRALRFHWLHIDPRAEGRTHPELTPAQHDMCTRFLEAAGFSPTSVSTISGELPTAYCIDRSYWYCISHLIRGTITKETALKKLQIAHKWDMRFFKRLEAAGAAFDEITPFDPDNVIIPPDLCDTSAPSDPSDESSKP